MFLPTDERKVGVMKQKFKNIRTKTERYKNKLLSKKNYTLHDQRWSNEALEEMNDTIMLKTIFKTRIPKGLADC